MYKISFYVKNPEPPDPTGKRDTRSTSGGVKARGTGSSSSDLTRDEKKFWNFVKKESKDIKGRYSTSKTSTGKDIMFNVRISGDREIYLFENDEILEAGKEVFYTNTDSFVAYSDYNYLQACILFEGDKPLNNLYEEVSQLCTIVQDVTGSLPTGSLAFEDVSSSSGSSRGGSEFTTGGSGSSSGGRGKA